MPKRTTIRVNTEKIAELSKEKGWSAATFAKKTGKYRTWLSEVARGHNLPSPEEAARMCLLLQSEPEEILKAAGETATETAQCQADIALVRSLIEKERPIEHGTLSEKDTRLIRWFRSLPPEKQRAILLLQGAPEDIAD